MRPLEFISSLPRRSFGYVLGCLALLFADVTVLQAQTVAVVDNNRPGVCLDFSKELIDSLKLGQSVNDFVEYVRQMTGVTLPPASVSSSRGLIPMRLDYSRPASDRWNTDLVQGYEIRVRADQIVLVAHTGLGFQNALYALLDRWGCRWVMMGKLGEVIPRQSKLTLATGTIRNPVCYNTSMEARCGMPPEASDWWRRNQGTFKYWLTGQHYWLYALPPEKHFKTHPEWYALIGGKRVPTQLCTSNPEVIAEMIRVAKAFLKGEQTAMSFPMDPGDNTDFCQCDRCRAQDPSGVDDNGRPLMTDRVLRFANEVGRGIAREYPDRVIAFYAYLNHTQPPVNVRPEPNVSVGITRSQFCLLHLLPHKECPKSAEFYTVVEKWSKVCSKVWTYDYDPISWTGCLPCPVYMEHAAAISLLARKYGVIGGVTDYVPPLTKSYAATYINAYMERRAKVDLSLTPDQILADMCQGFFGPAASPMERYYRELATATQYTHPGRQVGFGTYKYEELFNQKMIAAAGECINRAVAASANRPPYDKRVHLVALSHQYLEAYLDGIWSAQAGNYRTSLAAFDRLGKTIAAMDHEHAIDAAEADDRIMKAARLSTLARYFPDRLNYVRQWRVLGPFDNSRRDADLRTDPFEPAASIDRPVTLPDGSVKRWTSYHSPGGKILLGEAFKDAKHSWRLSYAYAGAHLEAKTARKVQFCMDSFYPFKVYLNGREIFYRPGPDAECPDKRVVAVDLRPGTNTVVLKLCQTGLGTPWGFYFRVKDMNGHSLEFQ